MTWGAIGGAAITTIGGKLLGGGSSQTATNTQSMDPRVAGMLFGEGGNPGLLGQYQNFLNKPQDPRLAQYGGENLNYLSYAPEDIGAIRNAGTGLLSERGAPQAGIGAYAVGNQIQAPGQNAIDLTGAYQNMIGGDAGANPYLNKAIQGGIDQSTNQFRQMQDESTRNLQQNVLGGIRGNSVLAGQYGGSRQGVAEGNAISDFTRQQQQAMTQFGQGNTNAAVGAQAQAFGQGQDRALAAMQGLGAQQYGVAGQNAATKNAAEFMNVGNVQQTNLANLGAQQNQNALNLARIGQGAGLLSGQLGGAAAAGTAQDQYGLNQAGKVNSLLAPYLGQVPGSSTTSQPMYSNPMGTALGGATAGIGLFNQLKSAFGNTPGTNNPGAGANGFVNWGTQG